MLLATGRFTILTLMELPVVSGAQNYRELCIAAKRRLAELKRKQQYLKLTDRRETV